LCIHPAPACDGRFPTYPPEYSAFLVSDALLTTYQ
jgi:hypothetical protein